MRSKSEVIIANMLHEREILFEYEREYIDGNSRRISDFTFIDSACDIVILNILECCIKYLIKMNGKRN